MAGFEGEHVSAYKKTMKTGKVVSVKEHVREGNIVAAEHALKIPGRPPIAGVPGQFAEGRSIPGVFLPQVTQVPPPDPMTSPQVQGDPLRTKADGKDKDKTEHKVSEQAAKVVNQAADILAKAIKSKVSGGKK